MWHTAVGLVFFFFFEVLAVAEKKKTNPKNRLLLEPPVMCASMFRQCPRWDQVSFKKHQSERQRSSFYRCCSVPVPISCAGSPAKRCGGSRYVTASELLFPSFSRKWHSKFSNSWFCRLVSQWVIDNIQYLYGTVSGAFAWHSSKSLSACVGVLCGGEGALLYVGPCERLIRERQRISWHVFILRTLARPPATKQPDGCVTTTSKGLT